MTSLKIQENQESMAPIRYKSTRGGQKGLSFEDVVLGGLATDKGLYVPESIPVISMSELEQLRPLSYIDLSFYVISRYISNDDVNHEILKDIITRSFSTFRHPDVTPLNKINNDYSILELFHGPTFAFKDVALQFLGNLFEHFLVKGKIQSSITILGATSGDTGSAAIHGLRGKKNVNCFIMYPNGKVTEVQEKQMITIPDKNVHCISINGDFDDCQALVKKAFADVQFRDDVKLGAINSINWARVLAQITYYFYSWLRITDNNKNSQQKVNYAVPTGNFGDILAGYYAKRMGLPIGKLVVAANENDVLHRFFETGEYSKAPCLMTIAPSMDISISSNFERYLLYLADENTTTLANWMNTFESTGKMSVDKKLLNKAREDFCSYSSNKESIVNCMIDVYKKDKYLLCPHTATSVIAVQKLNLLSPYTICLATAHPAKFEEAEKLALGYIPPRPKELEALYSLPTRTTNMNNNLDSVKKFMKTKLVSKQDNAGSVIAKFILSGIALFTVGLIVKDSIKKK